MENTTQANTPLNAIPIGIRGRPYPVMSGQKIVISQNGTGKNKTTSKMIPSQLEVLEKPVIFYSERTYAEAMGLAYREMPSPSMLDAFYHEMISGAPSNDRMVDIYIGGPGAGKSHLLKLEARMYSKRPPIFVDCGGKSLDEVLFETVLDVDAAKDLFNKIDERLAQDKLNPLSKQWLRKNLGKGWVEGEGKASIDWKAIGEPVDDKDTEERQVKVQRAITALEEVKNLEGLHGLGSSLGLKTQYGPLIKGWMEGRRVILDEYNKGKPGTDGKLQVTLQFLNGEVNEHTVEGGAGLSFTFRRSERKPGFRVRMSGNTSEDGASTSELARSTYDRLSPIYIPDPTEADIQHRICQMLTGVPVSTLHAISKDLPEKQPKKFTKMLREIRFMGLTEQQKQDVPTWQLNLIENWPQVISAAEKLAKFYRGWAEYIDPTKENRPAEIIMETDEMYAKQVNPGMRMAIKHIMGAITPQPESIPLSESNGFDLRMDWQSAPAASAINYESVEARFGNRLCKAILNEIANTSMNRGKMNLYTALMGHAAQCGIAEQDLQEATANTTDKTVAQLLNIPKADANYLSEATKVQKAFAELVRNKFPTHNLSGVDNDIVTVEQIHSCMQELDRQKDLLENNRTRYLMIPNPDYLSEQSADMAMPFILVPNDDMVATPEEMEQNRKTGQKLAARDPKPERVLETSELLQSFCMPEIRQKNLDALWNQSITEVYKDNVRGFEDVKIAENRSDTGIAVTSIVTRSMVKGQPELEELRVLRYHSTTQNLDKVLILGQRPTSKDLQAKLKDNGIEFFDRHDSAASKAVKAFVSQILKENTAVDGATLLSAFSMRHKVESANPPNSKEVFEQEFSAPDGSCDIPNYILGPASRPNLNLKRGSSVGVGSKGAQPVTTFTNLPIAA